MIQHLRMVSPQKLKRAVRSPGTINIILSLPNLGIYWQQPITRLAGNVSVLFADLNHAVSALATFSPIQIAILVIEITITHNLIVANPLKHSSRSASQVVPTGFRIEFKVVLARPPAVGPPSGNGIEKVGTIDRVKEIINSNHAVNFLGKSIIVHTLKAGRQPVMRRPFFVPEQTYFWDGGVELARLPHVRLINR